MSHLMTIQEPVQLRIKLLIIHKAEVLIRIILMRYLMTKYQIILFTVMTS